MSNKIKSHLVYSVFFLFILFSIGSIDASLINYRQEIISEFVMLESLANFGVSISVTGDSISNTETESSSGSSGSSSSGSSGGGGGDSSVTNVYNTYNTIEDKKAEEESSGDNNESDNSGSSGITGGVIGTGKFLMSWQIVVIIGIFAGFFGVVIILIVLRLYFLKKYLWKRTLKKGRKRWHIN